MLFAKNERTMIFSVFTSQTGWVFCLLINQIEPLWALPGPHISLVNCTHRYISIQNTQLGEKQIFFVHLCNVKGSREM